MKTGRGNGSNGTQGTPGGVLRGVAINYGAATRSMARTWGLNTWDESVFLAGYRPRLRWSHYDLTSKRGTQE
jgi:hypothetical protein